MVTIYNRTSSGYLMVFPHTTTGQFKTHKAAWSWLDSRNRPYNASAVVVTQMEYHKANRIYQY